MRRKKPERNKKNDKLNFRTEIMKEKGKLAFKITINREKKKEKKEKKEKKKKKRNKRKKSKQMIEFMVFE